MEVLTKEILGEAEIAPTAISMTFRRTNFPYKGFSSLTRTQMEHRQMLWVGVMLGRMVLLLNLEFSTAWLGSLPCFHVSQEHVGLDMQGYLWNSRRTSQSASDMI